MTIPSAGAPSFTARTVELGDIELPGADQQGYGPDDILPAGVMLTCGAIPTFLLAETRLTPDSMHPSYKELAATYIVSGSKLWR